MKEWLEDINEVRKEEGIIMTALAVLLFVSMCILLLPIAPFVIFNELSKTWGCDKNG